MSIKNWKIRNGYHNFDWIDKNEINTILQWYREKGNKKLRDKLQLQNLSKEDVINKLGYIRIKSLINKAKKDSGSYDMVIDNDKFCCIAPLNPSSGRHLARTMFSFKELHGNEEEINDKEIKQIDTSKNTDPNWCIASSDAASYWKIYDLYKGHLLYYFFMKEKKYHGLRFALVIKSEEMQNFINGDVSLVEAIHQFKDPTQFISNDIQCFNAFLRISGADVHELEDDLRDYMKTHNEKIKGEEENDLSIIATKNIILNPSFDNLARWGKYVDSFKTIRTMPDVYKKGNWEEIYENICEYILNSKHPNKKLLDLIERNNGQFDKEEKERCSNEFFNKHKETIKSILNNPNIRINLLYFILDFCVGNSDVEEITKPLNLFYSLILNKQRIEDHRIFARFPSLLSDENFTNIYYFLNDNIKDKNYASSIFMECCRSYERKNGFPMPRNLYKRFLTNPNKLASKVFYFYYSDYFEEALKAMSRSPYSSLKEIGELFNNLNTSKLNEAYFNYFKAQVSLYKQWGGEELEIAVIESAEWLREYCPWLEEDVEAIINSL